MAGAVPSGAALAAAHHSLVWGQQVLLLQTEAQAIKPVFNYIGTYREQAGTGGAGEAHFCECTLVCRSRLQNHNRLYNY